MSGRTESTSSDSVASADVCVDASGAAAEVSAAHLGAETKACEDEVLSLEALMLSRTFLYTLFHKALGGEPCGCLFEIMADEEALAMVDEYAGADPSMAELGDFFSNLDATADEAFVDAAKDEYIRTFVGPNRLLALPWESPYVSHEPVLFHKSTLAVRNAYHAHGWKIKRHLHIPDDHVSLLCCYMARLAHESLSRFEEGRLAEVRSQLIEQKLFVDEHTNNWLSEYAKGLRGSKKAPLYSRLVEGLVSFAQLDSIFAGEAIVWIDECVSGAEAGRNGSAQAAQQEIGSVANILSNEAARFAEAKKTLARLEDLRLRYLEDNELCDMN